MIYNEVFFDYNWQSDARNINRVLGSESALAADGLLSVDRSTEHHHMLLLGYGTTGPLSKLLEHLHNRCEVYGGPSSGNIGVSVCLDRCLTTYHKGGVVSSACSLNSSSNVVFPRGIGELVQMVTSYNGGDELVAKVTCDALELVGLDGTIHVENGSIDKFIVELRNGIVFPFKTMPEWIRERVIFNDTKILIVDGVIESTTDIEHLLYPAHTTQSPMVIVAAGFSDEVLTVLRMNFERGLVKVIPVEVPVELETVNVINDIATACSSGVVSILCGDLIVYKKFEDLPSVKRIDFDPLHKTMSVEQPSASCAIKQRRKQLLEQREEAKKDGLEKWIDARLRTLEDTTVIVALPDGTPAKTDSLKSKVMSNFLSARSMLVWGVVDTTKVQWLKEAYEKGNMKPFPRWVPAQALAVGTRLGEDLADVILRSDVLVKSV